MEKSDEQADIEVRDARSPSVNSLSEPSLVRQKSKEGSFIHLEKDPQANDKDAEVSTLH